MAMPCADCEPYGDGSGGVGVDAIKQAVIAAFNGRETKFLNVAGHEFHVKPIYVYRAGNVLVASGRISHHLSTRTDDQIYYTIVKENGEIKSLNAIDMSIERGGLGRMLGVVVPTDFADLLGSLIDGSWEGSCRRIVGEIAVQLR
ncbi:MAG: hypothetical protein KME08_18145 [Aphanothece sp. CMT-3BRIN-NPC111]|nr:hypothetical protein [Aphanothece sp. CMT-3BRIN-NPC111]